MINVREDYISKCNELNIEPELESYDKADRVARVYMRMVPKSSDPDSCSPYISIDIDGILSYFAMIIDNEVIVRILTKDKLRELGYI